MPEPEEQPPASQPQPEPEPEPEPAAVSAAARPPIPAAPIPHAEEPTHALSLPQLLQPTNSDNSSSKSLSEQSSDHHHHRRQLEQQKQQHDTIPGETQATPTTPLVPPRADPNVSQQQEPLRHSPVPRSPDASKQPELAPIYESQRDLSQESGIGDQAPDSRQQQQQQQQQQNRVSDAAASTLTPTAPRPATPPPPPPLLPAVIPAPPANSPPPDQPAPPAPIQLPPISSSVPETTETTVATAHSSNSNITPPTSANTGSEEILADEIKQESQEGDHDGSSTPKSDTTMSNHHYPHGGPRPGMQFSPSTGYTTSGATNAHYGYSNANSQVHDAYRPTSHAPTNTPMALPSMRTFDAGQQQLGMSASVAPQSSVSPQQSMSYYPQQMPMSNPYAGMTAAEAIAHQRYAIPGAGAGAGIAGGRHKKEIKRRTKTGCLTCRKRRIKCDELHPICKNCQKSKRDCLGYDPVFKNSQQSPSSLQSTKQHSPHANPHSATSSATPTNNSPLPSSASLISAPLAPNNTTSSYTAAPPRIPSTSTSGYSTGLDSSSHPSSSTLKGEAHPYQALESTLDITSTNKMKVSELIAIGGNVLPPPDAPLSQERSAEILNLYDQVYAPGLVKFFETEWFLKPFGPNALASSPRVQETMDAFLQAVANTATDNEASMAYAANLEFRVVWDLATLVYSAEYKLDTTSVLPAANDGNEARSRVAVFEALLSGEYLDHNPLRQSLGDLNANTTDEVTYLRNREVAFWYYLADFLRIRDQPGVDATAQREATLSRLRDVLDGRENRDVLYSLAIIRMLTHKFAPGFENTLPPHFDESDPKSKLAVARMFIQKEAEATGGTTNVVRRFAELAVRAFISPGNNIDRR